MSFFGPKKDAITKASAEAAAALDRDKMFTDAWWLQYCCCKGTALGSVGNPMFASEERQLCIHKACECTDVGGPFCMGGKTLCCFTDQCQFPPLEGSPKCVCFNKTISGDTAAFKLPIFGADKVLGFEESGFWLYYFLCTGVALHKPRAGDRPCFWEVQKTFCIKQSASCVYPIGPDGDLCSGLSTSCCFWEQCQFPPAKPAETATPCIACCGIQLKNKDKKGPAVKCMSYGKPA